MKIIWTLIFTGLFYLPSSLAAAQWIDVRSENFVYQGQASAAEAELLVQSLEILQANVTNALGVGPLDQAVPIHIFAVSPTPEFEKALPYAGFSVLSQNTLDGPVFLINAGSDDAGQNSHQVPHSHSLRRDLALYLMQTHSPDQYPFWMQSGFADYWASLTPGQSIEAYDYPLSRAKWVSMKSLVGALAGFSEGVDASSDVDTETLQRAQSWAAVRYIFEEPSLSANVPDFLNRLDAGQVAHKAFKRAFGMSTKAFGKRLKKNIRRPLPDKYGAAILATQNGISGIRTERLEGSAAELVYGDILSLFATTETGPYLASKAYEKIGYTSEQRGRALLGRAEISAAQDDPGEFQTYLKRAFSSGIETPVLHKRAGSLYLSQFENTGQPEWLGFARDHFQTARLNLKGDPALDYSYAVVCAQIECSDPLDVEAARAALASFRDARYIASNFAVLPLLDERGDFDTIIDFAEFARVWGANVETRGRAMKILDAVKRKKAKAAN